MTLDILKLHMSLDSATVSATQSSEAIQSCFSTYGRYFRLALPWLAEKDNIKEDLKPVTKEEISKWKSVLAAKKKAMNNE